MSGVARLVAVMALVMMAGCTDGAGGSTSSPSPSTAAQTTPSPTSPSVASPSEPNSSANPGSTSTSLIPGADCLTGTWRLVRFIGLGQQSTYGTGQGGDVTVTFDNGRYRMVGQGQKPFVVNLAGEAASLTVDGTVAGTYQPDGGEMSFTIGEATGQGTLQAGNERQTLPMASVSRVIAPQGKATLACPDKTLLMALPTVRLELVR